MLNAIKFISNTKLKTTSQLNFLSQIFCPITDYILNQLILLPNHKLCSKSANIVQSQTVFYIS